MDHITVLYKGIKADIHFFASENGGVKTALTFDRDGLLPRGRYAVFEGESPTLLDAREAVECRVQFIVDLALNEYTCKGDYVAHQSVRSGFLF